MLIQWPSHCLCYFLWPPISHTITMFTPCFTPHSGHGRTDISSLFHRMVHLRSRSTFRCQIRAHWTVLARCLSRRTTLQLFCTHHHLLTPAGRMNKLEQFGQSSVVFLLYFFTILYRTVLSHCVTKYIISIKKIVMAENVSFIYWNVIIIVRENLFRWYIHSR